VTDFDPDDDWLAINTIRTLVSLPSWALFAEQDQAYRDHERPPSVTARVAVEQAATFGWERWTGDHGTIIGLTTFGASAPAGQLRPHFGFTAEAIAGAVRAALTRTAALGTCVG
jgi:transketolase